MRDVVVIGGGLAGLISANLLASHGLDVLLLEKKEYPFHKVCGEYISNEVIPFLRSINAFPEIYQPSRISRLQLTSPSGKLLETELDMGGFGISRYNFDHFLAAKAREAGVEILEKTAVNNIFFDEKKDHFNLELSNGENISARVAIGSYGKRGNIDRLLQRQFFRQESPYLAVKYHFSIPFPDDVIALHNFRDGYCGVVKIEEEKINICYLVKNMQLKKWGSIEAMEEKVLGQNSHLKKIFHEGKRLYDKPEVINEISFADKSLVEQHVLMAGDAAGMIAPLCGNGMAMAIRGGKLVSEVVLRFFSGEISRPEMEKIYAVNWQKALGGRLKTGRFIQQLFTKPYISEGAIKLLRVAPVLIPAIVKRTHGKEF